MESDNEIDNESGTKKTGGKRKKSGNEYRQLRKLKEREDSAVSCSKVTDFFKKQSLSLNVQSKTPGQDYSQAGPSNDPRFTSVSFDPLIELSHDNQERGDGGNSSVEEGNNALGKFKTRFENVAETGEKDLQSGLYKSVQNSGTCSSGSVLTESKHRDSFDEEFDLFKTPNKKDLKFFFSKHPIVPPLEEFSKKEIPFSRNIFSSKEKILIDVG